MKYIILSILVLFSVSAYSQIEDTPLFVGKYFGNQSGGGSGYWQVTGNFTDESGYYDATSIQVGDVLFFVDSGIGYHLPVTSIISASGSSFTIRVNNTGISGVAGVPNGPGGIYRANSPKGIWPFTAGLTASDQQTLNSFLVKRLNNEPVKRDTFITVPHSTNYIPNLVITTPSRFYNNIYISCKGISDTSTVAFLAAPTSSHYGVVYNVKNDSGLVETRVLSDAHFSNTKTSYLLRPGQMAQVRALKDQRQSGAYKWAVNLLWDSTATGGGSGITALTGDVTASGTGSVAATIANNAVDSTKAANLSPNDLAQTGAATNDVLTWTGTKYAPRPASGGSATIEQVLTAGNIATKSIFTPNLVTTPLPNSDTVYMLIGGQSNAGAPNITPTVGDTAGNSNVRIWNWITNGWNIATVGKTPFPQSGVSVNSASVGFYLGRKINELTGKQVKYVTHFKPSTAITGWFNGVTRGPQMDSTLNKLTASGVPRIDLFVWIQGEQDNASSYITYNTSWDSIKATLRRQSYFKLTTPIVAVGMPQVVQGAKNTWQGADKILRAFDTNNDPWDIYAPTDSATVQSDSVHYNNNGLKQVASNVWFTYKRLPYHNNSTWYRPSYLHLEANDTGQGLNYEAIRMKNSNPAGSTGILMENSSGTKILRLIHQNTSFVSAGYGSGVKTILSAENSVPLEIWYNIARKMEFGTFTTSYVPLEFDGGASNAWFRMKNSGSNVMLVGSESILGGSASNGAFYVYGSNALNMYTNNTIRMTISGGGYVSIGGITATARFHLPAGTASATTAPLKLTSGTNMTTPESGAIEYDGTEFYATNSTASRTIVGRILKGSATLDFGNTAAGASTDLTITVTGAADGDVVSLSVPNASQTTTGSFSAWVSAANTVTVRYRIAALVGSEDPASGTFKVTVTK